MAQDPYEGLGVPVAGLPIRPAAMQEADPYAGLGAPADQPQRAEDELRMLKGVAKARQKGSWSDLVDAIAGKSGNPLNWARLMIGQGGLASYGDEIEAGVRSVLPKALGGQPYDETLKQAREGVAAVRQANPVASTVAELGGAVMLPIGVGGRFVQGAATLPGQIARGAALGAAYGGVSGFGAGEGVQNRLAGAAVGAPLGAAVGGALTPVATVAQEGIRTARNFLSPSGRRVTAEEGIARALQRDRLSTDDLAQGLVAPIPQGSRKLTTPQAVVEAQRLVDAGQPLDDVARQLGVSAKLLKERLQSPGDTPLSILDLAKLVPERAGAGANLASTAKAAAGMPGPARAVAQEELLSRHLSQQDRLATYVDRFISKADPEQLLAKAAAERKARADTLYAAARKADKGIDLQPVLDGWGLRWTQSRGPIGDAIKRAIDVFRPTEVVVGATTKGGKQISKRPITTLDQFLQANDELQAILTANRDNPKIYRVLSGLRDEIYDTVGKANPAWRAANDRFAQDISGERAIELGRDLALRLGSPQREALAAFRKLPAEQQALVRHGLAGKLRDEIFNPSAGTNIAERLSRKGTRDVLLTILGRKQATPFLKALEREKATTVTHREFQGSRTTPLAEDIAQFREGTEITGNLLTGRIYQALAGVYNRVIRGVTEQNADDVIRQLLETDPAQVRAILRRVTDAERRMVVDHIRRVHRSMATTTGVGAEAARLAAPGEQ